jgi:hypothetical protein
LTIGSGSPKISCILFSIFTIKYPKKENKKALARKNFDFGQLAVIENFGRSFGAKWNSYNLQGFIFWNSNWVCYFWTDLN